VTGRGALRSFAIVNFRVWFVGAFVSNLGIWLQRTTQDWVVLTVLTDGDAMAVGITTALQLAPQLLLLPLTGLAADRINTRRLLMITQSTMGVLGLAMAAIMLTGYAQLWQMYLLALLHGCAAAFDGPARQSFVSELVGRGDVANAVALSSTAMNIARLGGPALAGVLIAAVGGGWVFLGTGIAFLSVLWCLRLVRPEDFRPAGPAPQRFELAGGLRYLRTRPDLIVIVMMAMVLGIFGPSLSMLTATMAVHFGYGAELFGLLSTCIAVGAILAALLSASVEYPRRNVLIYSSALFGAGLLAGGFAPNIWLFGLALVILGGGLQLFLNTAHSFIQLTTAPEVLGRVLAIFIAATLALSPVGSIVLGWIADQWGAPTALIVTSVSVFVSTLIAIVYLIAFRRLRLRRAPDRRVGFALRLESPTPPVTYYGR
jgi:MFS family permease